jgi:nucleolar complex protein 3
VKPARAAPRDDDLPSVESHSDDESDWSSALGGKIPSASSASEVWSDGSSAGGSEEGDFDSDAEMPYETRPRLWKTTREKSPKNVIDRLPIKLADGRVARGGTRVLIDADELEESEHDDEDDEAPTAIEPQREDISTGARFGRPAVLDVIRQPSRKAKIQGAKEQIAAVCQEILADPENSVRESCQSWFL